MAKLYTKNTPDWADEILSTDERYDILTDAGAAINSNVQINLISTVAQAGTAVDATRMNNIEDGLDAVDTLLDEVNTELIAARGGSADLDTRLDSLVQTQIAAASTDDTPADADVFGYLVSGVLKKFTWANIKAALKTYFDTLYRPVSEVDGWTAAGETWTYASAVTFTVSGDQTAKYTAGVKIKLTQQTTAKYFYVVSSSYGAPNTTVTVTGGSDYTLANAAITNPYYSRSATPAGFPDWFTWNPLPAGWSSDPPDNIYKFKIVGRQAFITFHQQTVGTSDATNTTATLPVSASTANANAVWTGNIQAVDNGTTQTTPGLAYIAASTPTQLVFTKTWAAAAGSWTGSGNKRIAGLVMSYEI